MAKLLQLVLRAPSPRGIIEREHIGFSEISGPLDDVLRQVSRLVVFNMQRQPACFIFQLSRTAVERVRCLQC